MGVDHHGLRISVFIYLGNWHFEMRVQAKLFLVMTDGITKDNDDKLWLRRFGSDTRKKTINRKLAQHWTGLFRGVVEPPTLEGFKTWLDKATAHLICVLLCVGDWKR